MQTTVYIYAAVKKMDLINKPKDISAKRRACQLPTSRGGVSPEIFRGCTRKGGAFSKIAGAERRTGGV
jgi:hypothetical protein